VAGRLPEAKAEFAAAIAADPKHPACQSRDGGVPARHAPVRRRGKNT
jgi:hypothetical protein